MAKPDELKSSPERKVENRDRRLDWKVQATPTDGSDRAMRELVGQEYNRRTLADRDSAFHTLKHSVETRKGRHIDFADDIAGDGPERFTSSREGRSR